MNKLIGFTLVLMCSTANAEETSDKYWSCDSRERTLELIDSRYQEEVVFSGRSVDQVDDEPLQLYVTANHKKGTYTLLHYFVKQDKLCILDGGRVTELPGPEESTAFPEKEDYGDAAAKPVPNLP